MYIFYIISFHFFFYHRLLSSFIHLSSDTRQMTNSFNVNTIQSYIDHKRVFYCTTAAGPKSPAFRLSSRVYSVSAFAPPNLLSHLSSFDAFDISRGIFAKGDLTLFLYRFVTLPLPPPPLPSTLLSIS